MKRCPQCEFIYEDDQSLCDMDGILLVFDSLNLPKPTTPSRLKWRGRVIPAVAALVLATVFFLVYYVATRQQRPSTTYNPAAVTTPSPNPTEPTAGSQITEVPGSEKIETKPEEVQPTTNKEVGESKSKPDTPALTKDSKPKPNSKSAPRSQSSANNQEDDSKVGSILKKTGKLLKKPFKF